MEPSSNEHHLSSSSSSSSSSSLSYGLGTSSHAWSATSYSLLGTNGFHCFPTEQPSMAHDLSFQWADSDAFSNTHSNTPRTKVEFPEHPMNKIQFSPANQLLVPDFNQGIVAETPISYDNMNLEALDLLACSKFSRIFHHDSSQFQAGISGDGFNYIPTSLSTSYKVSASTNRAAEATKKSNAFKKPRLENRTYCPQLKVRKEKLGDRIAALQQLVAPFGKTDTASVLMEAIGYIKFLQNQVETLSVPYMKASQTKPIHATKHDIDNEETKHDLKSRGLCLVPLSCLSYVDDDGGGGSVATDILWWHLDG